MIGEETVADLVRVNPASLPLGASWDVHPDILLHADTLHITCQISLRILDIEQVPRTATWDETLVSSRLAGYCRSVRVQETVVWAFAPLKTLTPPTHCFGRRSLELVRSRLHWRAVISESHWDWTDGVS